MLLRGYSLLLTDADAVVLASPFSVVAPQAALSVACDSTVVPKTWREAWEPLLAWLPALLSARRLRLRPRSMVQQRHPRVVMMQGAVSKEDAESNARLLKALFSGEESEDPVEEVDLMSTIFNAVEERAEKVPPLRTPPRTPRGRAEPLMNLP